MLGDYGHENEERSSERHVNSLFQTVVAMMNSLVNPPTTITRLLKIRV